MASEKRIEIRSSRGACACGCDGDGDADDDGRGRDPAPDIADGATRARDCSGATAEVAEPREVDVANIMGGARILHIRHRGERYILRVTRHNKLILTK